MREIKRLIYLIVLFFFILVACRNYNYLPSQNEFKTSPLGSYIVLYYQSPDGPKGLIQIEGELIAVSNDSIYILDKLNSCEAISRDSVKTFELQHVKPRISHWTTAGFMAWSLTHGVLAPGTAFLNFIAVNTIHETIRRNSFNDELELAVNELLPFARFPRGLPDGVSKVDIK
tara:strand:- start:15651 stop:16169 length:519 start_codon:yes stop_codon:yes gene_type:complete